MVLSKAEEGEMFMSLRDWRKAVRTPPSYRVGKTVYKNHTQAIIGISVICLFLLFMLYSSESDENTIKKELHQITTDIHKSVPSQYRWNYNYTYPLTKPVNVHDTIQYKIGLVSDMDHSSRSKLESNTWISYYLQGTLIWKPDAQSVSITFDLTNYKTLKTKYSYNGRGMELSEFVTFNGKLVSFDDRSGIVYKIDDNNAYPWLLLTDGDGESNKGFKSEWATVKDEHLYVGSMGKEWTSPHGEFINYNPMWIKKISPKGDVESIFWKDNYIALRNKLGIHFPGYVLHESALWSDIHKKWFFLPRRLSHDTYNEETDETQGTNVLLTCDDDFSNIEVKYIGEVLPTHGFSSFKFIPGTQDKIIVALKTMEHNGQVATYVMVFTIDGKILLGETKVGDTKYEGLEFI